ncbi:hypothetical protein, partial [Nocardioides lacusdianchii]|uniref:hypothetical protein n=1 Tax=Nocardioides lacusdianchii TaxID=2783664 RepID=UPI001F36DA08
MTALDQSGNESAKQPSNSVTPGNDGGLNHCGQITQDETWTQVGVHVLNCTVIVPTGKALTVAPGTRIKSESGAGLTVYGTLTVTGTSAQPVVLTSLKDDSIGGDTNGDGGTTNPAPGDWNGINMREAGI